MYKREEFDNKLVEVLKLETGDKLLNIPGINEILSEEFNNVVLQELEGDE